MMSMKNEDKVTEIFDVELEVIDSAAFRKTDVQLMLGSLHPWLLFTMNIQRLQCQPTILLDVCDLSPCPHDAGVGT